MFKNGGLGIGAALVCQLSNDLAYSLSYWRDVSGYQDGSARVIAHHNMLNITLWVLVANVLT